MSYDKLLAAMQNEEAAFNTLQETFYNKVEKFREDEEDLDIFKSHLISRASKIEDNVRTLYWNAVELTDDELYIARDAIHDAQEDEYTYKEKMQHKLFELRNWLNLCVGLQDLKEDICSFEEKVQNLEPK